MAPVWNNLVEQTLQNTELVSWFFFPLFYSSPVRFLCVSFAGCMIPSFPSLCDRPYCLRVLEKFQILLSLHATLFNPGSFLEISPLRLLCFWIRYLNKVAHCSIPFRRLNFFWQVGFPCGLQCSLGALPNSCWLFS